MRDVLAKLNGTTKLLIQTGIIVGAVIGFIATFDSHYAKASDVEQIQKTQAAMAESQATTNAVLLIQYQTRKTILELKRAAEGLSPAEQVELQGIYDILAKLEK
jgi:hypothetical protein